MNKIAVVNKETERIETFYDAEAPDQKRYGGAWGKPELTVHLVVPEALVDTDVPLKAVTQQEKWTKDGEEDITDEAQLPLDWEVEGWQHHPPMTIVENLEITRNSKLFMLRSQRDQKIADADNERKKHEDSDPNAVATAQEWSDYRIALRAVTDGYKDAEDPKVGTEALDAFDMQLSSFVWPVKPS